MGTLGRCRDHMLPATRLGSQANQELMSLLANIVGRPYLPGPHCASDDSGIRIKRPPLRADAPDFLPRNLRRRVDVGVEACSADKDCFSTEPVIAPPSALVPMCVAVAGGLSSASPAR